MLEQMKERYLTGREDMRYAFQVLKAHPGYYGLLLLLVYVPIQVVLQYQARQFDFSVETMELMSMQVMRYGLVELVMMLLEEVAVLVVAVITAVTIDPTLVEDKSFSSLFYRGIRMWPRALVTLVVVLLGLVASVITMSFFAAIPIIGFAVIAGIALLAVLIVLLQSCTGTVASLRGRMGFDNIRYVFFVLQGRMWRAMGVFAIISVIGGLMQTGVSVVLNLLFAGIEQPLVQMIISVVIAAGLSIISLYNFTVGAVLFLGAEYRKENLLTQNP